MYEKCLEQHLEQSKCSVTIDQYISVQRKDRVQSRGKTGNRAWGSWFLLAQASTYESLVAGAHFDNHGICLIGHYVHFD